MHKWSSSQKVISLQKTLHLLFYVSYQHEYFILNENASTPVLHTFCLRSCLKKNSPPPSTPTFSLLNPIAENYLAFLWVQLRNSSVISLLSSPNLGFLMSVHGLRGRWGFPKYQTSLGNPFEPLFLDRADICIWLSEQTGRCYTRDGHWKACSIRLPKQIQ